MQQQTATRSIEPLAQDLRSFRHASGAFHTGRRSTTPLVTGTIQIPQWLILATIDGGAKRLEVEAACGHRYRGPERAGVVSIVAPNCERRLRLYEVSSRWASVAFDTTLVERALEQTRRAVDARCVSNVQDQLLYAVLAELTRTCLEEGSPDASYFDALLTATIQHLATRYSHGRAQAIHESALATWQMRRIEDYVEGHLEHSIRISDLAAVSGLSDGYFHRAFRRAFGMTPLEFINRRRIERAREIWDREPSATVVELALRVGYTSPSYFARTFRRIVGINPGSYVRRLAASAQLSLE